jgi:tetratricopeptide (TPR) repeat protein
MKLKLLRSTLYMLAISALFTDGAIAQASDASAPAAAKAKFANDYNAGKFNDVIADADILRKNGVLDAQSQLIIGQAYYKARDYSGCVEDAQKNLDISPNQPGAELLERCRLLLQ